MAPSSKSPEADSSCINSLTVSWVIGFDMVRGIAIFVERVGLSLSGEIEENVQRVFVDDMTEIWIDALRQLRNVCIDIQDTLVTQCSTLTRSVIEYTNCNRLIAWSGLS